MGQAQLESDVWCCHTWAWMQGTHRMQHGPFFATRSSKGKTSLATNPFFQLTVLGQSLVDRPGADIDGDENEEDQE